MDCACTKSIGRVLDFFTTSKCIIRDYQGEHMDNRNNKLIKLYSLSICNFFWAMLLVSCGFLPAPDCKQGKIVATYKTNSSSTYQGGFVVYNLQIPKMIQNLPLDPSVRITGMALSPDGNNILYGNDADSSLYLLDLRSGQKTKIYQGYRPISPVWSPNGVQAAFADGAVTTFDHVYVININNSKAIQSLSPNYDSYDQLFEIPVAWSQVDNNILLEDNQYYRPPYTLAFVHPDGSGRKSIYTSQYIWVAALSPDGKLLILQEGYPLKGKPYLYNWQSDKRTELPNMPLQSYSWSWSPNGKCIAFLRTLGTSTSEMDVYNLETNKITNLPFPQMDYGWIAWGQ